MLRVFPFLTVGSYKLSDGDSPVLRTCLTILRLGWPFSNKPDGWTMVPAWCPEWPLPLVSFGIEMYLVYKHFLHRPSLFGGIRHVEWCFSGAYDVKHCRCVCKDQLFSHVAFFGGSFASHLLVHLRFVFPLKL